MKLFTSHKLMIVASAIGFATLFSTQAEARPRLLARIFGRPVNTYQYVETANVEASPQIEGDRRFSYEPTYESVPTTMGRTHAKAPWQLPKSDPHRYDVR